MTFNIKEIKEIFNYLLDTNLKLIELGKLPISISLTGESGCGKTSAITQLAEERGAKLIKLNLAQIEETGDLLGFAVKEYELVSSEGVRKWIPEKLVDAYLEIGYKVINHIPKMGYAKPQWVPEDDSSEFIFLLDDYTRADPRILQALMQVIEEQKFTSWKLPKKCHVILTTNPANGDYSVFEEDYAQSSRRLNFNMHFDINEWAKWAEFEGINDKSINFAIAYKPELFDELNKETQQISARSITMFFKAINNIENWEDSKSLSMINAIASGCFQFDVNIIGNLFTMFIKNKLDKIPSPEKLFLEDWKKLKPILENLIYGKEDIYNPIIANVIYTRLFNCIKSVYNKTSKHKITKKIVEARLLEIMHNEKQIFAEDIVLVFLRELIVEYPSDFSSLFLDSKVIKLLTVE